MRMINNALSGTQAAQAGLNATSQNLANLLTPGYSRQGVVLATCMPGRGDGLSPGSGVTVVAIRRYNDDYKNLQLWQANTQMGGLSAKQPYFRQLEQVAGSEGTSLSSGLDKFYGALNAASVEPGSIPLRQQVIEAAGALCHRVNNLGSVMNNQLASLKEQRANTVSQINSITANLAKLNEEIAGGVAAGLNTSGLQDERDRQIDALSAFVDVSIVNQPDGSKTVTLRDGQPLVVGSTGAVLSSRDNPDGTQTMSLQFGKEKIGIVGEGIGGQLGGINAYESEVLRPMQQSIKTLVGELASGVNDQLNSGVDLAGKPGKPLFSFDGEGRLQLADISAEELAFAGAGSAPGNSDNLQALIELKDKKISFPGLGTVTLGDAYSQMVGRLATQSQQNEAALSTAKLVRAESENNWLSTSGVNQDEEGINLMEFQKMYQANMKVVAVANTLFDSTLAIF